MQVSSMEKLLTVCPLNQQVQSRSQPYKTVAWEQVKVKGEKNTVTGMMQGDQLDMPNVLIGKSVKVNGKDISIKSYVVDERDDMLKITLAMASPTKEKSDDKPTQGSD